MKLFPRYCGGVVHVLDASRAAVVAQALLDHELKGEFLEEIDEEYEELRTYA